MGPTARATGLMPLAFLPQEGHRPMEWIRAKTLMILDEIQKEQGKERHFQGLLPCAAWGEGLFTALAHKKELFPFKCRRGSDCVG